MPKNSRLFPRVAVNFAALAAIALALSSCGNSSSEKVDDKFMAKAREYFAYKDKNREIIAALPEMKEQLPAKQTALAGRQSNLADQKAELETLSKMDEAAYVKVSDLIGKPNQEVALIAATQLFLRDYPLSPRAKEAQALIDKLQPALAQANAQKAADLEKARQAEAARRRDLDARFAKHSLSVPEMQDYLVGRSQSEIISLLGEPDSRNSMYWDYARSIMLEKGKPRGAQLIFDAGRVKLVTVEP